MATKPLLRYLMIQFVMLLAIGSYAQQPQGIRFEGLARDNSGNLLASQAVSVKLSILSGGLSGEAVYVETHQLSTGSDGMFDLLIGTGSVESGSFQGINWGNGSYYLKVEMDPQGGSSFEFVGTSAFLPVPYALFAQNAGNGFSGDYNDLSNKPELFDGKFQSLQNLPNTIEGFGILDAITSSHPAYGIAEEQKLKWDSAFGWGGHNGMYKPIDYTPTWDEISGKPAFAPIAFTGNYELLTSKPQPWDSTWASIKEKPEGTNNGDMLYWQNNAWQVLPIGDEGQFLVMGNGQPVWSNNSLIPEIETVDVSGIGYSTASTGGLVIDTGASAILQKGVCWSTDHYPTITNSLTNNGAGTGSFTTQLANLLPSTTYYLRAYAINSIGASYGSEMSFTTQNGQIEIVTNYPTSIESHKAVFKGTIVADGGLPVSSCGFCYSLTPNPTIGNGTLEANPSSNEFTASSICLTAATTYYLKAYAINSTGVYYGNEITFSTTTWSCSQNLPCTNHDLSNGVAPGNVTISYTTLANIPGISANCWLGQNLGNEAPSVSASLTLSWIWQFNQKQGYEILSLTSITPATAWITTINESSDWLAANDPCAIELANGWRIPTKAEWNNIMVANNLKNYPANAFNRMKITDVYVKDDLGTIYGEYPSFWTSTQSDGLNAFISNQEESFEGSPHWGIVAKKKSSGYPIRCIKP